MEEEFFNPPSTATCSKIRNRARVAPLESYASIRSVKDLTRHYCDPNDPCCAKPNPEIPDIPHKLEELSGYNPCAPKNPMHFEYTILHRYKMRYMLRRAAERQLNPNLTQEELAQIVQAEVAQSSTRTTAERETAFSGEPELNPDIPPPDYVSFDGRILQSNLDGLTNMALVHEIALNKDFRLAKPDKHYHKNMPLCKSHPNTIHSPVFSFAIQMKEQYWNRIDRIFEYENPNLKKHKQAILGLFETLRRSLYGTLYPHNTLIRNKINEIFNPRILAKQIDAKNLNVEYYIEFIMHTLSSLCCPHRDNEILAVRKITLVSRQMRKLMDLMESMSLDMANFVISQSRAVIVKQCGDYERNKFANYVALQYRAGMDPIRVTRNWILRHTVAKRTFDEVMAWAFNEILDWDEAKEWPETLALDWTRFPPLRREIVRLTILASILTSVNDFCQPLLNPGGADEGQLSFDKKQLKTLKDSKILDNLREELNTTFTADDFGNYQKLEQMLDSCATHTVKIIDDHLVTELCQSGGDIPKDAIKNLIRSFANPSHPLRLSFHRLIREWLMELISSGGQDIEIPFQLKIIDYLIEDPVSDMVRICIYNRGVFDVLYREIYSGACPPPRFVTTDTDPVDDTILALVSKLDSFSEKTTVYRMSQLDPRLKPMYNPDGSPIIPKEYQALHKPPPVPEEVQKQIDKELLEHEPTLEEDYEGVQNINIGDPDYMFGHTTEQLLKMLERENIINANKLRRIKARVEEEGVRKRVHQQLPVFHKLMNTDWGHVQKEHCRLTRIIKYGHHPYPTKATDDPRNNVWLPNTCNRQVDCKTKERPKWNEKGERIFYSRNRGRQFGQEDGALVGVQSGPDFEMLHRTIYSATDISDNDAGAETDVKSGKSGGLS